MDSSSADRGEENKSQDTLPEEWLNIAILCTVFVYKAMNGLGTLATIWATVVLLGGFSTLIKEQDFWYVTVIAFVQSIGILGGYEDPAHQIFMRAPGALKKGSKPADHERQLSWWRRRQIQPQQQHAAGGIRRATLGMSKQERLKKKQDDEDKWKLRRLYECRTSLGLAISVALRLGQVAAVTTCMVLSLRRLKKQDYVEPEHLHQDDHQNISQSLNIFYWLVVAQGIIFICMLLNVLVFGLRMKALREYRLFGPSGHNILSRYEKDNYLEVITGNVRATLDTDLVTFASNLAVSSSMDDQLLGIRAMDRILRAGKYRRPTLMRLRASLDEDTLKKLVSMLGFIRTTEEQDIRGHAARVVLKLTPDLLVQSHPQILYLISSSLLNTSTNKDVDLLWFGLRILDKLTDNPENSRQAKEVLLDIIDLVTNLCARGRGHGSTSNIIYNSWIEQEIIPILQKKDDFPPAFIEKIDHEIIFGMAFNILSKLLAASPVAAAGVFMRESSQDFHFLTNAGMILNHFEATRVISCLAVDEAARKEIGRLPDIIKNLKDCLLSKAPYLNFSKVAAKLLLLEYTASSHLDQLKLFINENNILQDQSFSLPVSAFIQELHMHELSTPLMQRVVQDLDLEDVLSASQVNHSEEAAKALILLTTECESNVEAFLQEINQQELENIVKVLSSDGEKDKRKMMAHFEGRNLDKETLFIIRQILCAEGEELERSMHAKLLQNLRTYSGTKDFNEHMQVIDQALPMVFKAISDEVLRLEDQSSTNENISHESNMWIKEGKVIESFIGLAVQICRSKNATDFAKALHDANVSADTLVKRLKKILELYRSPTVDFPCIRRSTLELLTWIVQNNSNNIEILLQCGVYEQLNEVARTGRKLESFKLFHCGVGVPTEPGISCICSLATELRQQLQCSPNFKERSHCYSEQSGIITILLD